MHPKSNTFTLTISKNLLKKNLPSQFPRLRAINLTVKKNKLTTIRYIFDKWENNAIKSRFGGSFTRFETEIRNEPDCPEIFKWIPSMWFESGSDLGGGEEGLTLEVTYWSDKITPEDIEKFFHENKIHCHRATPFNK